MERGILKIAGILYVHKGQEFICPSVSIDLYNMCCNICADNKFRLTARHCLSTTDYKSLCYIVKCLLSYIDEDNAYGLLKELRGFADTDGNVSELRNILFK